MKKLAYFMLVPFTLAALSGCGKFVEGYDVSPNEPVVVTPGLLLSAAEVATFSTVTGNMARTSCSWTQQMNGAQFQTNAYGNYALFENDTDNDWNTIYINTLQSLNTIITDENYAAGNPRYVGIAKVLKAYNLGIAADYWGDVPNKEALKGLDGEASFNPKYDSQESVIADVQALLTSAIEDLAKTDNKLLPSSDDFIYGGDAAAWTKTAWALKARYANRLSKKNPSGSATEALGYLANAYSSSADDMMTQFDAGTGPNQWNAFEAARPGYIRISDYFVNALTTLADPRLPFYAELFNGAYVGSEVGSENTDASPVGSYLAGSATTPTPMVTYVEMKFIEAEAKLRSGDAAGAATAHNDAIKASILQVTGAPISAVYEAAQASETGATINLNKIMNHKYVALFGQMEVFSDWRRTDIPSLTPSSNGVINSIPRRFPTPLGERVNNTSCTSVTDLTQKVWWDQ